MITKNQLKEFFQNIRVLFKDEFSEEVEFHTPIKTQKLNCEKPITILIGIQGDLNGHVLYNLSPDVGIEFIKRISANDEISEIDENSKETLNNMFFMVTECGFDSIKEEKNITLTPSMFFKGEKAEFSSLVNEQKVFAEMKLSFGIINLNFSIKEGVEA